jgi:hypothetical protein
MNYALPITPCHIINLKTAGAMLTKKSTFKTPDTKLNITALPGLAPRINAAEKPATIT